MPRIGRSRIISTTAAQTLMRKLLLLSSRPAKILKTRSRTGSTNSSASSNNNDKLTRRMGSDQVRQKGGSCTLHQYTSNTKIAKTETSKPIQPPRLKVRTKQAAFTQNIVTANVLATQPRHANTAIRLRTTAGNRYPASKLGLPR